EKGKDSNTPAQQASVAVNTSSNTSTAVTASGVNPPDFFEPKLISSALNSPVRGLISGPDLVKKATCICSTCGQHFIPYLTITNSNSSSSPITTHLFLKEKEVKIPFISPYFILGELSKIFVQKPIQVITSPQFICSFNELFWNILWGWALLQVD